MGRRKSKRKPPPKKKMTGNLDTQFTCPFCNHEKSCDVKMERTRNTGIISCSVCLEEFQTPITCILLTNKRCCLLLGMFVFASFLFITRGLSYCSFRFLSKICLLVPGAVMPDWRTENNEGTVM
uniref:Transcription elongation factor 1 homolog n=1 Tax=Amphilophus citrinellus TaxID=61819 RepID=A0A3Q0RPF7_AMPCI